MTLARLERLEREATPGPWLLEPIHASRRKLGGFQRVWTPGASRDFDAEPADAALIAESRNALPALLRVARVAQELDKHWADVNWTYTVGHPYSQALKDALAALEEDGGEGA